MMTRTTIGDARIRVWMEPTGCWYWATEDGHPYGGALALRGGGFATMGDAIENAQRAHGDDVRICHHSEDAP